MRKYQEAACRNLLRPPLVLGVSTPGLLFVVGGVLGIKTLGGSGKWVTFSALGFGVLGYLSLWICGKILPAGFEEEAIEWLSTTYARLRKLERGVLAPPVWSPGPFPILARDALEESDQIRTKESLRELFQALVPGAEKVFRISTDIHGAISEQIEKIGSLSEAHVYSLTRLPVVTAPLWLSSQIERMSTPVAVYARVRGLDPAQAKKRIEGSRKRNSRETSYLRNLDSEVTYQEASSVLEGLSRGDEKIVELSLAITSPFELTLDPEHFAKERNIDLALRAVTGQRPRPLRPHWVRALTAADLIPQFLDPRESGFPVLKTLRGRDLYYSPLDPRLEALHGIVVGATGTGKSVLIATLFKRLIESGANLSVLFLDHKRSYRRWISATDLYEEPGSVKALSHCLPKVFERLGHPWSVVGLELAGLPETEHRLGAKTLLGQIESFLTLRGSAHPIFIILDECWEFLRNEPELVQREFREFRKLNAGAWAVTQSICEFLSDDLGRSIFQNTPTRILMRQGEDPAAYRGILGLNDVETKLLRYLTQSKAEYSECLIKTPFMSRVGRLHPTASEYRELRTDNLREELVQATRLRRITGGAA